MKNRTCCFTGHRKQPPTRLRKITQRLEAAIIRHIEEGYLYFGAGGALGFDTLAAQTVLRLKDRYPDIRLILVLPCVTQADGWKSSERKIYNSIMVKSDKVVYTSREYSDGCMFKRNRHLVDNSSACICYLTEAAGGTAYTVNYAARHNLKTTNVAETSKQTD